MELQRLQEQLEAIQADRKRVADSGLDTSIVDGTIRDLQQQITEIQQNQQAHEVRMEEASLTISYILDTMNVEGLTIAEIITNDDEYKLVRKGVQDAFIAQAADYSQSISDLQAEQRLEMHVLGERVLEAERKAEQLQTANSELEVKNYQLTIENDDLSNKVTKGAELLTEANGQIEQKNKHIDDLQLQISIGVRSALNVVHVPQDTSELAEKIKANKPRITDVKFKDEYGIDLRLKTAVEVLTGKEIEYEAIYERRYIILNLEEAAQYRAEIEQKKAEEEAQNAVIPTLESPSIEPVLEQEAPAEEIPFQAESEVQTTDSGTTEEAEGNRDLDEVVEQNESEVVTLESLKAEIDALKSAHGARLDRLDKQANLPELVLEQAVA